MRILQLPSWYLPEGGNFCLHQAMALQEKGIEVHILANVILPWRKYGLKRFQFPKKAFFCTENNILIYRNYAWRYPLVEIPNIEKWTRKTLKMFDQYIKTHGKPDIIHAHSSTWAGYAASLIKAKYNIPYVITEHRGIFGSKSAYAASLFRKEYDYYLQSAFSNADYIIPVSTQLRFRIDQFSRNEVPIKAVSNILNTDYFYLTERKKDRNHFLFVSVNGFFIEKGYDILLPAFDKVCETSPQAILRIIGENFDGKDFKQFFKQIKHKDKISFAGEVNHERVRAELWNADAFVIASRVESQSVATMEAMSTGLPIIATEVIPENLIIDAVGIRVPIEDINALKDAMERIIKNQVKYNGQAIAAHVKSIASKEVVTKQLTEIYKEIIQKK